MKITSEIKVVAFVFLAIAPYYLSIAAIIGCIGAYIADFMIKRGLTKKLRIQNEKKVAQKLKDVEASFKLEFDISNIPTEVQEKLLKASI